MNRRDAVLMTASTLAAGFSLAALPGTARAASLKRRLVGTWSLVSARNQSANGAHSSGFGGSEKGLLILDASGHVSLMILGGARRRFAGGDRLRGTAEENQAAVAGTLAYFGTWTVDSKTRVLTFKITASSFANFDGSTQLRPIVSLTDQEMHWHNPTPTSGASAEIVWRRAR